GADSESRCILLPTEEVEFSGGLRGQRFEALSTDFVYFFRSLPEGHAEADEQRHHSDQEHRDDQFGLEPPSSRGTGRRPRGRRHVEPSNADGKVMVKAVPWSTRLSTSIVPRILVRMVLTLYSPNPVPLPGSFVVKNGSKI